MNPYLSGYILLGVITAVAFWWWFVFGPGKESELGRITDADDGAALVCGSLVAGAAWPLTALISVIYGLGCLTMRVSR